MNQDPARRDEDKRRLRPRLLLSPLLYREYRLYGHGYLQLAAADA